MIIDRIQQFNHHETQSSSLDIVSDNESAFFSRLSKSCTCNMSRIGCRTVMPDFIPPNIRSVVVYGFTLGNTVDFSDPGWTNVTYLSINPDASIPTSQEKYVSLHPQEFRKL